MSHGYAPFTILVTSSVAGASHKSGSYVIDGYTNRSSVSLSTSGQPTSTAGEYQCFSYPLSS